MHPLALQSTEIHQHLQSICTARRIAHHQKRKPAKLAKDYEEGLDFRSAVCSLLCLALGTRGDILFIVNKLAKACTDPGRKDFEALLWLFGHLRAEPRYGSQDVKKGLTGFA